MQAELLNRVDPQWREELLRFVETGKASPEFLAYLDGNEECQRVVDLAFNDEMIRFEKWALSLASVAPPPAASPAPPRPRVPWQRDWRSFALAASLLLALIASTLAWSTWQLSAAARQRAALLTEEPLVTMVAQSPHRELPDGALQESDLLMRAPELDGPAERALQQEIERLRTALLAARAARGNEPAEPPGEQPDRVVSLTSEEERLPEPEAPRQATTLPSEAPAPAPIALPNNNAITTAFRFQLAADPVQERAAAGVVPPRLKTSEVLLERAPFGLRLPDTVKVNALVDKHGNVGRFVFRHRLAGPARRRSIAQVLAETRFDPGTQHGKPGSMWAALTISPKPD